MGLDVKPEILAPAGTLAAVAPMFEAGADAVYLGGKRLNMRMQRPSQNLTDEELATAVALAHDRGKRLYVTLNSLLVEAELEELRRTVALLGQLRPDAIIVQDLAVATLVRELCPWVPLHASTMMNVHSVASALALKDLGFSRVITSRDIPLHQVRRLGEGSGLEMEYFVHGDMCIAQSGLCYLSTIVFGESSNRGRCMKPCRWRWSLVDERGDAVAADMAEGHLLARKDLCLFQHIPALVQSGIVSFKIEGRMRPPEFTGILVAAYREAVDAYFADPLHYAARADTMEKLWAMRVRDLTTCHALGNPGAKSVDPSGGREPRFFSQARAEPAPTMAPASGPLDGARDPELIAHVATRAAAEAALEAGVAAIYLGGDEMIGYPSDFDVPSLARFAKRVADRGVRLAVLGPRIADDRDMDEWRRWLDRISAAGPIGVGVSTLGALAVARQRCSGEIIADFSLNVANSAAAECLAAMGATRVTASVELNAADLADLIRESRLPVEFIGQGPVPGMLLEHCVIAAATGHTPEDVCPMRCRGGAFALRDAVGQDHRIVCDRRCRNHLYAARDVCVLPHLGTLAAAGPASLRIEAQFDPPEAVATIVAAYRDGMAALRAGAAGDVLAAVERIAEATGRPQGGGAFAFNSCGERKKESSNASR